MVFGLSSDPAYRTGGRLAYSDRNVLYQAPSMTALG